MTIEIRDATPEEVKAFYGQRTRGLVDIFGAFDGDRCIGLCGVMRDPRFQGSIFEEQGRLIAFLNVADVPKHFGIWIIKGIADYLKKQTEPVFVQCEDNRYPQAERLLRVVGFKPTDEFWADFRDPSQKLRLWKWQG